jgi:alpha-tubulin suppressor-like RCC1 family protein
VLNSQGLVQCKGAGFYGQLGNLSDEFQGDSSVLVPMLSPNSDPLPIINKLASAANTNFGVTVKNTVLCWGADEPVGNGLCVGNGQNDDFGGTNIAGRPNLISQLNNVISVAAGQGTACAVRADGKVMCWGENDVGQLGRGSHTEREKPALVGGLDAVQQMALGTRHACAATKDGKLFCWGSNRASQLGATCGPTLPCQTTTESESFVAVPRQAFAGVTEIRAGGDFNCVITSPDSKVLCWGSNTSGQLGNGQKGGTEATPKPVVWK